MTGSPISRLPPEVLHQVLKYLPIDILLRFGRTSRRNYSAAISALQHLRLAIFPKETQCMLVSITSSTFTDDDAFLADDLFDTEGLNWIKKTAPLPPPFHGHGRSKLRRQGQHPPDPAQYREKLFRLHNALASSILSTPTLASLRFLTLHLYHIDSPYLTQALANLASLRDLHLNFHHPYLHDPCLPGGYWTNPAHLQPSPIWDAFGGAGLQANADSRLRKLKRLTLERAGIDSSQLRRWLECNPNLKELRLRNVAGVDLKFVQWLGTAHSAHSRASSGAPGSLRLEILALENCSALVANSVEDFSWLDSLFDIAGKRRLDEHDTPALHTLSLKYSTSVSTTALCAYLESRTPCIEKITLPQGCILVPRSHKRSHSNSSIHPSGPSSPSKTKKRARTQTMQSSNHQSDDADQSQHDSGVETDSPETGMQDLNINEFQGDERDESSEEDESTSKSPVSYLRIQSQRKLGHTCRIVPSSDVIEPDPDAS